MVEESFINSKLKERSNFFEWNTIFKTMAKIKKRKYTAGTFLSTKSDEITCSKPMNSGSKFAEHSI